MSRKRIAVVASLTLSLTNFRYQLLKAMVDAGHDVTAFAPENDKEVIEALAKIGIRFVQIPMKRTGLNPFSDLQTLWSLFRHLSQLKPDVLLAYTMKPIVYGGLAARLARVPHRFALFTGMGHVFAGANPTARMALIRHVSVMLYRMALKGAERVFVYNSADEHDIREYRMLDNNAAITPVAGSGVDLNYYTRSDPPTGEIKFLLMARLLKDKGIFEYANAARVLHKKYRGVSFQLLGPFDPHSTSVSRNEIEELTRQGMLDYLGETRDVRPFLAACSVFVLPSYYREGIPRSILEALATGRAIITTDAPGCRETVIEGGNGFLVPARDHQKLAAAMERFITAPELITTMGARSHQLVRERFDVHAVNRVLLTCMRLIQA